jgi:hypothetical protein
MFETRRQFLAMFGAAGASLGLFAGAAVPQVPKFPPPPNRQPDAADDDSGVPKSATKAALEDNDKSIKKRIEKLFELASDLKAEVEKTDSAKVLSLGMVKKAEEIEKLAREIKTRARG